MNNSRQQFWIEALKGGTIIGLVTVAFSLLVQFSGDNEKWISALNFISTVVTILLTAGYLRRFARLHTKAEGFSYGRGVGFVVAMMIFVGVLSGIYSAVMANFVIKAEVLESVDLVMAQMQDVISADQFESTYNMMRASVTNPMILTLSSVLGNVIYGLFMGLVLSIITRRQADIFAEDNTTTPNENNL